MGSNPTSPAIFKYNALMKCTYKNCKNEEELVGRQTKFCSTICKVSHHTLKSRSDNKSKAIAYKGGCCERCGYNKSKRALEFHHLDPSQKDFQISSSTSTRSWSLVKSELDKCIMLCANCHAEEHDLSYHAGIV